MWAHKLIIHLKCPECIHAAKEMNTPSDLSSGAKLHSVASVAFLSNLEKKHVLVAQLLLRMTSNCSVGIITASNSIFLCCVVALCCCYSGTELTD